MVTAKGKIQSEAYNSEPVIPGGKKQKFVTQDY
jgi:hypothetical protein